MWITTSFYSIIMVVISSIGIYFSLIIFTRIAGLRSFSKMSSFDFAITVAFGSILASVVLTKDPPLIQGIVALLTLFLIQMLIATLRESNTLVRGLVDNTPLLLMRGTKIYDKNLKKAKVTHDDLRTKLRKANVTQMSQIKAVVMEVTGDISVLHHHDQEHELDDELLKEVEGWE